MTKTADTISSIEGFILRCPMPAVAGNALRVFSERSALLLRIKTHGGLVGWGETWAYPYAAAELIKHNLAQHVLGRSVTNPRSLHQGMLTAAVPDRRGQTHMALSALDLAAWDAFGRSSGRSIAELLGGRLRSEILTYASGPLLPAGDDRYEGFEEAIEGYVADGFRAVKIRVGIGMKQDIRAIQAARSIVGDEALLMIDLNESSTVEDTLALADATKSSRLAWIEEPLRHDNISGYRRIFEKISAPLSGGESFCGVQAFKDVMVDGSLAVLQPDLAICGGISEAMKVAGLAEAFDTGIAPHVWGTGINFLASLQYASVLPGYGRNLHLPIFEYDKSHNPLRAKIFDPCPDTKGRIAVPDGPGLGMEINIEALSDYVVEHWELNA
ncbi:mandelate racemase/muconate lactonizing enzyme family protein [Rhizobium sp. NTR19]|uniref:Mandelate racemase/muconate lactonizing enzyme family protein n=1 Tax=Neorhizobium turbinariae TaxID=2937795 RepID=A0ABT0IXU8_9HYPH|nr:mandelate racemase/muconate lactonizing enzyme family protein [Neorhizobium turbinariae]MCK8782711.1 mandelate racemase/muconate lactonizing enzyme family protein [Neorhizobium turbinariae]